MMLDIAIWPEQILKQKTDPVTVFDDELKFITNQLFETMYAKKGIGLAANQCFLNKSMFVMDYKNNPLVVINPIVVEKSETTIKGSEGCLSFEGFLVDVYRSTWITLKYQDLEGSEQEKRFEGMESVIVQHESQHLEGITIINYLSRMHRDMITRKLQKKYR